MVFVRTGNSLQKTERNDIMFSAKKAVCVILAALLCATAAGCGGDSGSSKKKKKKKIIVIQNSDSSQTDTTDSSDSSDFSDDDSLSSEEKIRRSLYVPSAEDEEYKDVIEPEYKVKAVSWDGPAGYTVVYPEGSNYLKNAAKRLAEYFKTNCGTELNVVSDSAAEVSKEILVGNTNRRTSSLSVNEYAVTLSGNKLIFEGGHYLGAVKAATWFRSFTYKKGEVNALTGKFDFEPTRDGYEYVWGDEFDGDTLDSTKWTLTSHMTGTSALKLSDDPQILNVSEGRLKLTSRHWFDPDDKNVVYGVPYTVMSKLHMNFQYGYLEMRARIPSKNGVWPSLWISGETAEAINKDTPAGLKQNIYDTKFFAEIDIFEIFSSVIADTLVPNIHKWYMKGYKSPDGKSHVEYNNTNGRVSGRYRADDGTEFTENYHLIGCRFTENDITMYYDGKEYCTFNLNESIDDDPDMNDFRNPLFIMINNHIKEKDVEYNKSTFPFEYYIDYIRLYQKPGEGGLWVDDNT